MPTIIELMQIRGYSPCLTGMCYGIAGMASQAVIRNDGFGFAHRIKEIKNNNLGPETIKKLQIDAFLDGISVYMGRYGMSRSFSQALGIHSGQNISRPASFFSHLENEHGKTELFVPLFIQKFVSGFYKRSLMYFLEQIKRQNPGLPFSLLISFPTHAVQIGFDCKKWLSVNHDRVKYDSVLLKVIDNILEKDKLYSSRYWIANIDILSSTREFKIIENNEIFDEPNISTLSLSELGLFLQMALCEDHHSLILPIIKKISEKTRSKRERYNCLLIKDKNGITGLSYAFALEHLASIKMFLIGLKTLRLSPEQVFSILEAKMNNGAPSLFYALKDGHDDIVRTFVNELPSFWLMDEQNLKLMAAKDGNGTPGLSLALQNGNDGTISAFIEGLHSLYLANEENVELLEAKNSKGTYGVVLARQNGHDGAVSAFVKGLDSVHLTNKQKKKFLRLIERRDDKVRRILFCGKSSD